MYSEITKKIYDNLTPRTYLLHYLFRYISMNLKYKINFEMETMFARNPCYSNIKALLRIHNYFKVHIWKILLCQDRITKDPVHQRRVLIPKVVLQDDHIPLFVYLLPDITSL